MLPRKRVSRNFKPGKIRGSSYLSYGLDSEEDETLRKKPQELPNYLWRFLLADAWIRWRINIIFTKVVIWCMFALIVAAISGLIIGPSKIYWIEKEILLLEVQEKEEDILQPSLLVSNRKLTEVDLMYKELVNQQLLPEESKIRKIVQDEISQIEEEKLGLPDFASEISGATIIGTPNTKNYLTSTVIKLLGFPLWMVTSSPRNAIQASVCTGECWAFHGSTGNLRIQLAAPAVISSFSLYHIPKQLSITGDIKSAPQDFSVIGINNSKMVGEILLGDYEYNNNGPPQQMFHVQRELTGAFSIVELRIHSNYGNEEYTCVYRFQVHGKLATQ